MSYDPPARRLRGGAVRRRKKGAEGATARGAGPGGAAQIETKCAATFLDSVPPRAARLTHSHVT